MNVKIVSFFSFDCTIIEEFRKPDYVKFLCSGDQNLSIAGDMDFIETDISRIQMNPYINEMTGILWIGCNLQNIGDCDFIGTAHYRRYFRIPERMTENQILCKIQMQPMSIFGTYKLYHNADDLRKFNNVFSTRYQEYAKILDEFMKQRYYASRNMFIMSKKNFIEYHSFMAKCVDVCNEIKDSLNLDIRDKYQMRALGFILERMSGFWIYMMSKEGMETIDGEMITESMDSPYQRV